MIFLESCALFKKRYTVLKFSGESERLKPWISIVLKGIPAFGTILLSNPLVVPTYKTSVSGRCCLIASISASAG